MRSPDSLMRDGRTLAQYLDDYRRMMDLIARGTPPTLEELADAPLVFNWTLGDAEDPNGHRYRHILGYFDGHPYLSSGTFGHTSPLLQLDPGMRWARCRSRLYRLERRLPPCMGS